MIYDLRDVVVGDRRTGPGTTTSGQWVRRRPYTWKGDRASMMALIAVCVGSLPWRMLIMMAPPIFCSSGTGGPPSGRHGRDLHPPEMLGAARCSSITCGSSCRAARVGL